MFKVAYLNLQGQILTHVCRNYNHADVLVESVIKIIKIECGCR